jgi:ubiquinone/menaquinone biosynthesis C-methylase UbiE
MADTNPKQAVLRAARPFRRVFTALRGVPTRILRAYHGRQAYLARHAPPIRAGEADELTEVDGYWGGHTVYSPPFATAGESSRNLEWRFEEHPLFREFSGLWGEHDGEVVLDYGCGPGNDLVGFLIHTGAEKVIGLDISREALELARRRIALHRVPRDRVELIQLNDSRPQIPLPDGSVDFLQSQGVLQHTSDPLSILRELHRVLKPGGEARVMVYNRESVWLHLYTAYVVMELEGQHRGVDVEEAFQLTTDGPECPIARCWRPRDFTALCAEAGFETEFLGGYLTRHELEMLSGHLDRAVGDPRLAEEHRGFLRSLEFDRAGLPLHGEAYAGVGGAYLLRSPASSPTPDGGGEARHQPDAVTSDSQRA